MDRPLRELSAAHPLARAVDRGPRRGGLDEPPRRAARRRGSSRRPGRDRRPTDRGPRAPGAQLLLAGRTQPVPVGPAALRAPAGAACTCRCSPPPSRSPSRARAVLPPRCAIEIKWPNDVLIDGRKTSGINLPVHLEASGVVLRGPGRGREREPRRLRAPGRAPRDRDQPAHRRRTSRWIAWPSGTTCSSGSSASSSRSARARSLRSWSAFANRSQWPGKAVRVGGPGLAREVVGTVHGVDEDGALLVKTRGGPVERILAGDVTLLEREKVAPPCCSRSTSATPTSSSGSSTTTTLLHHWRIGTHRQDTSDECAATVRSLFELAGVERTTVVGRDHLLRRPAASADLRAHLREAAPPHAAGRRAGHPHGHADPRRQPARGRRRPDRERGRDGRAARHAGDRDRLRHGHELRLRLPATASSSAARSARACSSRSRRW